jgi:hypothetical protein
MKVVHTFYAADEQSALAFADSLGAMEGQVRVESGTSAGEWGIILEQEVANGEAVFAGTDRCEALAAAMDVEYDGHEVEM